jgi:6-phosphofructokinase 1
MPTGSLSEKIRSLKESDCDIQYLGDAKFKSPLQSVVFVEHEKIYLDMSDTRAKARALLAGPREKLFFDPAKTKVGIVTCGGLCPGLNNVVRAIVMCLWHRYNIQEIYGFRFGFEGLNPETSQKIHLEPDMVRGNDRMLSHNRFA